MSCTPPHLFFFLPCSGDHRDLHSFPTRRSSDLDRHRVRHRHSAHVVAAGELSILAGDRDRKSTRLNSSHMSISYAVFCLKKKIGVAWSITILFVAPVLAAVASGYIVRVQALLAY